MIFRQMGTVEEETPTSFVLEYGLGPPYVIVQHLVKTEAKGVSKTDLGIEKLGRNFYSE